MTELIEVGKMAVSAAGGVAGMCIMQWWQRRKNAADAQQAETKADLTMQELISLQSDHMKKLFLRVAELEGEIFALRSQVVQLQKDKDTAMVQLEEMRNRLNECEERSKAAVAP